MAKKNQDHKTTKLHVKKGDTVLILSGADKGAKGKVLQVLPKQYRAVVENANVVKRHTKPTADNPGGIIEKFAPIHLSNLMVVDSKGNASRITRKVIDGKRVRVSKKTEEVLD